MEFFSCFRWKVVCFLNRTGLLAGNLVYVDVYKRNGPVVLPMVKYCTSTCVRVSSHFGVLLFFYSKILRNFLLELHKRQLSDSV